MALPELSPVSTSPRHVLPPTGSQVDVTVSNLPYGTYVDSAYWSAAEILEFQKAASSQVAHTYRKLGGDVLEIEMTAQQVYAAYEEACLEYSYLLNIHHGKNIIGNILGSSTGSFDAEGQITGSNNDVDKDFHLSLKYPKFDFAYARRVTDGISEDAGVGGSLPVYSASFAVTPGVQDYDLQALISAQPRFSDPTDPDFEADIDNRKILIRRVWYKTPQAMWRFYGYYGALNLAGNMTNYGMYSDSTTWEIIPAWHNILQSLEFEHRMHVRVSHFSYELKNNKVRLFPIPSSLYPNNVWIEFSIPSDPWEENPSATIGIDGIANLNSAPFQNVPFKNINSIGRTWSKRYALALCKEMLGNIRSKFASIPIPGNDVTLNGPAMVDQGKSEQEALRDELKEIFDSLTYSEIMKSDADLLAESQRITEKIPMKIFVG